LTITSYFKFIRVCPHQHGRRLGRAQVFFNFAELQVFERYFFSNSIKQMMASSLNEPIAVNGPLN